MSSKLGKVYLVGAGPGDPGLLTLKGLDCLKRADLVLYDGLVNPLLLRHTAADAERTCRSPSPEGRTLRQVEINQRLIDAARQGKTVVRLKGGDPFIFGRGSEEAAALVEAGIPFEVVPGITAATAAGEYAGISLTHRRFASEVAFITGHEDPSKSETTVDYDLLARFDGTLVFYMGLHRLEAIVEALLKAGKDPQTPACVISRATTPAQQVVSAALCDLQVDKQKVRPPSLIIVGECVRQREQLAWFEQRPLFGRSVGITRPAGQAEPVIARLLELGAEPVLLPTIEIRPPDDWAEIDHTLQNLDEFDWLIFTSANGVESLLNRLWKTGGDVRRFASMKLAAIGSATAEALANYHLRADLVPATFRAEALAAELAPHVSGKSVLWARASRGRDVLPDELHAAGARVQQLVVYQNLDVENWPANITQRLEAGRLDWVGLSSPSIAANFRRLLSAAAHEQIGKTVRLASISPVTTAAAEKAGLTISAEATEYTWNGICDAIVEANLTPCSSTTGGPS